VRVLFVGVVKCLSPGVFFKIELEILYFHLTSPKRQSINAVGS
jgi:hypothetical protein